MFYTFDYTAPKEVEEAVSLAVSTPGAVFLAGGTDLCVNLRGGKIRPSLVIDLKNIESLKGMTISRGGLEIGALTTMHEIVSAGLPMQYALLQNAASIMGCLEIRYRATLGGNIVNASPGGETITPLAVLEAQIVIRSARDGVPCLSINLLPGRIKPAWNRESWLKRSYCRSFHRLPGVCI